MEIRSTGQMQKAAQYDTQQQFAQIEKNAQANRDRNREVEEAQARIVQQAQESQRQQAENQRRNLQLEIGSRVGTIVNTTA